MKTRYGLLDELQYSSRRWVLGCCAGCWPACVPLCAYRDVLYCDIHSVCTCVACAVTTIAHACKFRRITLPVRRW